MENSKNTEGLVKWQYLILINEFERLLNKTKQYESNMSSDILVSRLLKAANFSEYHEQLRRATICNLNYDVLKHN